MVLICICLVINYAEHLFMWLLVICVSSLEKCLFKSFAHSLTGLFVFCCLLSCSFYNCLNISGYTSGYLICKYFLPFWVLTCYSVDSVLQCTKVFHFDEIQFVYSFTGCLCLWCHIQGHFVFF